MLASLVTRLVPSTLNLSMDPILDSFLDFGCGSSESGFIFRSISKILHPCIITGTSSERGLHEVMNLLVSASTSYSQDTKKFSTEETHLTPLEEEGGAGRG